MNFTINKNGEGRLRSASLIAGDKRIQLPIIVPQLTEGAVPPFTLKEIAHLGTSIISVDPLQLSVHPGLEVIKQAGSLADFLGWSGMIISLPDLSSMAKVKKNLATLGARYTEPYTGADKRLLPDCLDNIQNVIQPLLSIPLFQNADYYSPVDDLDLATKINLSWQKSLQNRELGIIGGGGLKCLRNTYVAEQQNKVGYLITNLPSGDNKEWSRILNVSLQLIPIDKFAMVVAEDPEQLLMALYSGVDVVISSVPMKLAHRGKLLTTNGLLEVNHQKYEDSNQVIPGMDYSLNLIHYYIHNNDQMSDRIIGEYNLKLVNQLVSDWVMAIGSVDENEKWQQLVQLFNTRKN